MFLSMNWTRYDADNPAPSVIAQSGRVGERTFVHARERERERVRWELGIGRSRQDSRKSPDGPVS